MTDHDFTYRHDAETLLLARGVKDPDKIRRLISESESRIGEQMVIEDLMRERGVGRRQAQHIARQIEAEKHADIEVPDNLRKAVMEALYRQGSSSLGQLANGIAGMGFHPDPTHLTAALWACQKQGWVSFRERHSQHGSQLSNIKLTQAGRSKAIELRGTPKQASERANAPSIRERGFSQSPRGGGHHAAGIDGTDFRHHRKRTTGDEIEREHHRPVKKIDDHGEHGPYCVYDNEPWPCQTAVDRGITAEFEPVVISVRTPEPPKQNEQVVTGEETRGTVSDGMGAKGIGSSADTPTQYLEAFNPALINWANWPHITGLMDKVGRLKKIEQAMYLLQESGEKEIAESLLEKIQLTAEQEEFVAFIHWLRGEEADRVQ